MILWLPILLTSATALLLFGLLRTGIARRLALDIPNARSLHQNPTPRVGGIVALPLALTAVIFLAPEVRVLALSALGLVLVSWFDDRSGMPILLRLVSHIAAAILVLWFLAPDAHFPVLLVAVLAIVWMTNLYNFMDGANGMAGGMAVIGFGTYSYAFIENGAADWGLATLAIAASMAGFLPFNLKPARVFLGDAGSIPLGFLAGAIGFAGYGKGCWPLWFPILAFSPFVVDASTTLLRRALRGERVWQAHREHAYQKLVTAGWSHERLATAEWGLMAACCVSALCLREAPIAGQVAGLSLWATVYLALIAIVESRSRG